MSTTACSGDAGLRLLDRRAIRAPGADDRGLAAGARFSFDRLRLHGRSRLPADDVSDRALLARTGFEQEGYARQYLCIAGKWQDHLLFAILREKWRA